MSDTARVLLLTAPACKFCEDAKQLLARLATEFPLEIETLSTDQEAGRALALTHGVLFPPGIFIDGEFVQYGRPSERKLRARLTSMGLRPSAAPRRD